jgi:NAD+ synthase (glutamine-hydrolysing)
MKIALVQFNPIVGDLKNNTERILKYIDHARELGVGLVVFPELALLGYPPKDLLLLPDFVQASQDALNEILPHTKGIGILLGSVMPVQGSDKLYNSAILMENGQILDRVDKFVLPDYDAFDEGRYFTSSPNIHCLTFRGMKLGVTVGEDLYADGLCKESPDLFINISASAYQYAKQDTKNEMIEKTAAKYDVPFLYVNQVGGNEDLIFEGSSMIFNKDGRLILQGKHFEEDFIVYDPEASYSPITVPKEDISWMYKALVLGLRDYVHKTGFKSILLGLSGGIDSTLVACLAVDALGKENVLGVSMPSRYSTQHSKDDARDLAENLGMKYKVIPIEEPFSAYLGLFNDNKEAVVDLAEENIQARIRGNLLMFLSNREGHMLVTAENKSEIAMGYSTLYGDMCGSLGVIGDVLKTQVYELCRYINRDKEIIPANILTKPPSAELRPNQLDTDSLPAYDILDEVIRLYMDENYTAAEIVGLGFDRDTVLKIINAIDGMEYKRYQAPPALKLTSKPLGKGRRMPIIQRFRRT